ncbi:hypothetical protein CTA2_4611 [Colletotrichum tanaceti]|uniref:Nucleic acid-binding protein n=1 Tax=Colletotrichum tanaceti TaxID=1306861 RepID=A0A4V6DHG6_9PEZI|nr:hypothetical protein CTA2_4611 [Colletotrichum tanaceti]TKW56516.1 hypothetical protein CTA1_2411 [Colletotrichum tanaceti]
MSTFSIQASYQEELPTSSETIPVIKSSTKDVAFTQEEVEAGHNPLKRPWNPTEVYEEVCIDHIQPGPTRIRFTGRIVNYAAAFLGIKNIYSRPAHQLIVADGTGAIRVKLLPIGIPASLLSIGKLVTVWASWTSTAAGPNHGSIPFVTMYTPINPADAGTKQFIQFLPDTPQNQRLCRVPLEYAIGTQNPKPLPGLMTLGQYLKTGHEIQGARILVCVENVGARKLIMIQDRTREVGLLEVTVFDDTASCVLTLWEDKSDSAKLWKPSETMLLLTSPKLVPSRETKPMPRSAGITLNYNTLVDVDPDFQDAKWLREWVKNRVKKEDEYLPFPKGVWDADQAVHGPFRPLFTLAEVDDFARSDPATNFTGKLNLAILEFNLLELYGRDMMCSAECCGIPLHSNQSSATCKKCMKENPLVLNPGIMGTLADETGCVVQGKLVWSDAAWSELFFPATMSNHPRPEPETLDGSKASPAPVFPPASWRELTRMETNGLKILEEQMLYTRLTLTFG